MDLFDTPSSFPRLQDGVKVLRRKELLAAGATVETIRAAMRRGDLDRIAPGRFRDPSGPTLAGDEIRKLLVLAVADRNRTGVISHRSAAALHGLPLLAPHDSFVHLTRPQHGGGRHNDWVKVHAGRLEDIDVVEFLDLRVTTISRTLIDLARSAPFETAVVALDHALHHCLVSPEAIAAAARRLRQARGMVRARHALRFADGRSESVGESRCRVALYRAGAPEPELQVVVRDPDGLFLGRSDFGWIPDRALLEFDGRVKYVPDSSTGRTGSEVLLREKGREDLIRRVWVAMGRAVWTDLNRVAALGRTVEELRTSGRQFVGLAGAGILLPSPPIRIPL